MKVLTVLGFAAVAALAACDQTHVSNRPNPNEGARAGDRAAEAAGEVGRGAVRGVETVGHGVVFGARELGQSLSGTQGNPQAEALSQQERQAMERRAAEARQHMDQAGNAVSGGDQGVQPQDRAGEPGTGATTTTATPPTAQGGGPR